MLSKLLKKIDKAEREWRYSFGDNITDPVERRKSVWHFNLFDHAFLRVFWTNFYQISDGVWRSNQPTHKRFAKYRDLGIKSVINLRGTDPRAHYLFEEESCKILGLKLYNTRLWARRAAGRENIIEVIDLLRTVERPMMFHCKSGADRAGFCAAMYQMIFDNVPLAEARKQLSFKYLHIKASKTGVLDYTLDIFEARQAKSEIDFETWIRTEYDSHVIQAAYEAKTPANEVVFDV
jgi:protein tyrosine/serine phosphatase